MATRIVRPFVFEENGKLTGFSVDLWDTIAQRLNARFVMQAHPSMKSLLQAVQTKNADASIAAISITSEREAVIDFSQPMFESGLQILVRDQDGGSILPSLLSVVFTPALLQLLGIVLVIVLVPAHIIWFFERRHPHGIIENRAYFPGIFKACWWAAGTLGAQADEMPKSTIGRFVAVVWMFSSIAFIAYFTAAITASLTVQQLHGDIRGPDDLAGKRVATTAGSTSAKYLRDRNIKPLEFAGIEGAYRALLKRQADAVVFDSPVLLHYAAHEGKGKVEIVGTVFRKENYGIAVPRHSALRKPINRALLSLQEDGTYQKLYDKWFSETYNSAD
ncbi:MAG TPA: transporter substrate-binding domain-containing protein [Abditibacteriaceae bacterium]|nr:transporter substrate-binding domain-containing protein [Abditibacteriaceae bacterium]